MNVGDAQHICRNPWGWSEEDVREARLFLADEVERLTRPGWKLVPERATEQMLDAAYDAYDKVEESENGGWCGLSSAYQAMIAAAPEA